MTIPVHSHPIASFMDGKRRVLVALADGTTPGHIARDKTVVDVHYQAGDVLLANERDEVICGPVGLGKARAIAESVLNNDARTITNTHSLLILATVLVAMDVGDPEPPLTEPEAASAVSEPKAGDPPSRTVNG